MKLQFSTDGPAFRERALLKDLAAQRRAETLRLRLKSRLAELRTEKPAAEHVLPQPEVAAAD